MLELLYDSNNTIGMFNSSLSIGSAPSILNCESELEEFPLNEFTVLCTKHHFVHDYVGQHIHVWARTSGKLEQVIYPRGSQFCACNDTTVVSAHSDIFLWDITTGAPIRELIGHTESVTQVLLHGSTLISMSKDSTIRVWDMRTGMCKRVLSGYWERLWYWKSNTRFIAFASNKSVWVLEVATCDCKIHLEYPLPTIFDMHEPPIKFWLAGDLFVLRSDPYHTWNLSSGKMVTITADLLTCSSESHFFFTSTNNTVSVWDTTSLTCVRSFEVAIVPESLRLFGEELVVFAKGKLEIWDANTGECKVPSKAISSRNSFFQECTSKGHIIMHIFDAGSDDMKQIQVI